MSAQPALPDSVDWPEQTVAWWAMWADSPQAAHFVASDWSFLLDTALLHAAVWGNGEFDRLSELRMRVSKFGATPEDRARLRAVFVEDEAKAGTALDELASRRRAAGRPDSSSKTGATRQAK